MSRTARRAGLWAAVGVALIAGVGLWDTRSQFDQQVQKYLAQTDVKALAVAGNPNWAWVAGYGYGFDSVEAASARALASCEGQRADSAATFLWLTPPPCRIYAVGDRFTAVSTTAPSRPPSQLASQ